MTFDRAKRLLAGCRQVIGAGIVALLLAACVGGPATDLASIDAPAGPSASGASVGNNVDLERDYVLGHNDRVEVRVFGQEELTGEYRIDANGQLSMPLLGNVDAQGKTVSELGQEIKTQLQNGYLRDPQVTVQVTQYRPFFIVGGVNAPGSYEYMAGMTVLQAIAMAGGYSDTAFPDSPVIVTRGSTDDRRRGSGTTSTRVFPGDTIEVPQRQALGF